MSRLLPAISPRAGTLNILHLNSMKSRINIDGSYIFQVSQFREIICCFCSGQTALYKLCFLSTVSCM